MDSRDSSHESLLLMEDVSKYLMVPLGYQSLETFSRLKKGGVVREGNIDDVGEGRVASPH